MSNDFSKYLRAGVIGFICGFALVLPAYEVKRNEALKAVSMLDALGYKLIYSEKGESKKSTSIWIKTVY